MKFTTAASLFSLSAVLPSALGASYGLTDNIVGSGFYSAFSFQNIADPTHGRVWVAYCPISCSALLIFVHVLYRNYVNQATAQSQNLTFASSDSFILRADYKTVLNPSGAGRNSVRIRSNKVYTTHVAV